MSTSSSNPLIRDAQSQDVIAIAGLLTQLNRAEGSTTITDANLLAKGLFGEGREVNLRALVAEQGGEVIAAVLYYRGYDVLTAVHGYHLADFVVEESVRRRGVGKQLFAALAEQNLREGGHWVSLTVLSSNERARSFYNALGMTHVPVDFFAIGERGLRSVQALLQK